MWKHRCCNSLCTNLKLTEKPPTLVQAINVAYATKAKRGDSQP